MTKPEEVAQGTYRLEAKIPGLPTVFAVYFIKETTSAAIIEPGPAALIPAIQNAMKELTLGEPEYIIPTHIHLDHAGSLGKLVRIFPKARLVLNPLGVEHMVDPSRLIRSTRMAFGDFEATYGEILPVPRERIKVVEDREKLTIDGRELIVIHTPGHAPHHNAIFDTKTRGLFCGEALGLIYGTNAPPLPAVAPPSFEPNLYLKSMAILRELRPRLLFYSHGGVGKEPDKLISAAIENTKIVGKAILESLKRGKTDDVVIHEIGDFLESRFVVRLDAYDLATNVSAYIHYYRKKGLT